MFFSYSHKDEALRDQLESHLALLKNQGLIDAWYDRRIVAETRSTTPPSSANFRERWVPEGVANGRPT